MSNKDNFQRVYIYLNSSSLYSDDTDEMIKTRKIHLGKEEVFQEKI